MIFQHGFILSTLLTAQIVCYSDFINAQTNNKAIDDSSLSVTENEDICKCVPYYLCKGSDANTSEGLIDIHGGYQCESYLEVCCKHEEITSVNTEPTEPVKHSRGCGWRNPKGVGLYIPNTGYEANFGEFPWMVAVLLEDKKVVNIYKCGGSLIHPQAVITAAHCVSNKTLSYLVRAGEWDTQTTLEILEHQNRKVKSVIIHPQYDARTLTNNIAILILESPFELADHIDVTCLPPQEIIIPNGTSCWTQSWGKDSFGAEGRYQTILKRIALPIVDHASCQEAFRRTRLGVKFQLHNSFTCAGGESKINIGKSDEGSPLVCPIPGQPDRYQQVGISAWGIGYDIPAAYSQVALFREWIDKQMALNNLTTAEYEY